MLLSRTGLIQRARSIGTFAMDSLFPINESVKRAEFSQYASFDQTFDIFLSHRYEDRQAVEGLADMLVKDFNYSVYIDWIVDPTLDRSKVNKVTAEKLRNRIRHCKCLWYVTSNNSHDSKWMPWETGMADGCTDKVAICPLSDEKRSDYVGLEYLSLYPYVDKCKEKHSGRDMFWVRESVSKYCSFDGWLNRGEKPIIHT